MRTAPSSSIALMTALFALWTSGCVDKEKCDQAISVTRDALQKDQPDLARQWRDRAWAICNDATQTAALDKEIVAKETALAQTAAATQVQVAASAQQRMNTATSLWRSFDKLDPKEQTVPELDAVKAKADRMGQGLPPEYGQQVNDYNAKEYARRQRVVAATAAAAK